MLLKELFKTAGLSESTFDSYMRNAVKNQKPLTSKDFYEEFSVKFNSRSVPGRVEQFNKFAQQYEITIENDEPGLIVLTGGLVHLWLICLHFLDKNICKQLTFWKKNKKSDKYIGQYLMNILGDKPDLGELITNARKAID